MLQWSLAKCIGVGCFELWCFLAFVAWQCMWCYLFILLYDYYIVLIKSLSIGHISSALVLYYTSFGHTTCCLPMLTFVHIMWSCHLLSTNPYVCTYHVIMPSAICRCIRLYIHVIMPSVVYQCLRLCISFYHTTCYKPMLTFVHIVRSYHLLYTDAYVCTYRVIMPSAIYRCLRLYIWFYHTTCYKPMLTFVHIVRSYHNYVAYRCLRFSITNEICFLKWISITNTA